MAIAITQGWMESVLTEYTTLFGSLGLKIRLFQNDFTPDDASVFADFDEADFSGYDGAHDCDTWSAGGITWIAPRMTMPGPIITWTSSSGGVANTIYGYYVTDSSDNLIWAERRAAGPLTIGGSAGQTYTVQMQYTTRSEFNSTS